MGRGNACVFGDCEGLFYIRWDNFPHIYADDNGEEVVDYDMQHEEWENSLYEFKVDFMKKFKSFSKCNLWVSDSERAVLENSLFYIVVEDNQWSMAIKLIQKEQEYGEGNIANLQKKHYTRYLDGMRDCLFNQFNEIGTYVGAWSSGTIYKRDYVVSA